MTKKRILETKLSLPKDLKKLSHSELKNLASELRVRLLEIGDECGGHLASNLGVVELTIALHTVLNSPTDKIVWDTSHQSYVHKMLTGRLDRIMTIRKQNGLSGFTKINESDHDAFGTGHASTALSAAVGLATARDIKKETHSVCAVIGDSSLSGGMSFEALNNIERIKGNFICVLNDNNMAISKPVGSLASYMTKVRTSTTYNKAKNRFERILGNIPKIGVPLKRRVERLVDLLKDMVLDTKMGVIFEELGFRYLGPLDGHNIPMLMLALKYAKNYKGPIMIHIITKKGKGHLPAEKDPTNWHGISPKSKTPTKKVKTYTTVFGETVTKIAKVQKELVVITPAMTSGSGLNEFAKKYPTRFYDVGIAEEHAVTFCAGLARAGLKPVLAIYSSFLQRGYDQVIHDVCLQNLPVVFAIDRAGMVGEDGPTHHGCFDYSFLLHIPNIQILAPKDGAELISMLNWATKQNSPIAIRYSKGGIPDQKEPTKVPTYKNKAEVMFEYPGKTKKPFKALLIAAGSMSCPAYEAAQILAEQKINTAVINLKSIKPLDTKLLKTYIEKAEKIFVIEEGSAIGGVSPYILQECSDLDINITNWHQIAIPDEFVTHGKLANLRKKYFLDTEGITKQVLKKVCT
jgi:1-deoxy-D-xylulose-5-phosphate synthase